jgi:hypothetical protein
MENKTFYALVLGALAVAAAIGSVASVSFASAQSPENVKAMKAVRFEGAPDFLTFNATIPEIKGSVDAGKELLSLAQVDFTTAAKTASEVGNGTVISGQMAVEQDYLVYSFDVVSGGQERTLIIDAGNGKVLHMTEARPVDVWAELGHGGKFGLASYPAAFSVANVEELVQPAEEEEQ